MKKLLAAFVALVGISWWRKRAEATPAGPDPAGPDPAEELRAKLAEQRTEPAPAAEPEPPADVESRRSEVHDRARQAIEDLSTPEE